MAEWLMAAVLKPDWRIILRGNPTVFGQISRGNRDDVGLRSAGCGSCWAQFWAQSLACALVPGNSLRLAGRGPASYKARESDADHLEVPEPLASQSTQELAARARLLLVVDEVRAERMTRATGARALGMTLDEFLIEAGPHGLVAVDYDVEDFRRELAALGPRPR